MGTLITTLACFPVAASSGFVWAVDCLHCINWLYSMIEAVPFT